MALRTVAEVQPRRRAMRDGVRASALASKIWQRRRVKASAERNPCCNCCRCEGGSGGTKMWEFILHYSPPNIIWKDLVCGCTSRTAHPRRYPGDDRDVQAV